MEKYVCSADCFPIVHQSVLTYFALLWDKGQHRRQTGQEQFKVKLFPPHHQHGKKNKQIIMI